MRLHDLKPQPGAKRRAKRLGCGESSGRGKTSGRGHKGQKSRSGSSVRPGFEGGQIPLIRRLPKRGFNNVNFKKKYGLVNVDSLGRFPEGTEVNEELLREQKLIRGRIDGVKILGRGDLGVKLSVEADVVTASARAKIEKAGGSITLRRREPAEKAES